jgi:predicted acyltransferase
VLLEIAAPEADRVSTCQTRERMVSLDVFRGISIAGMILVNNAGSWKHVYHPLQHADWNGWTLTDLLFPFFLFTVGVAITLSFSERIARGGLEGKLFLEILRRTLILFGLGILLSGFPHYHWPTVRIPGVLQRIALCYFCSALIFMKTGIRGQAITTSMLLAIYWLLM